MKAKFNYLFIVGLLFLAMANFLLYYINEVEYNLASFFGTWKTVLFVSRFIISLFFFLGLFFLVSKKSFWVIGVISVVSVSVPWLESNVFNQNFNGEEMNESININQFPAFYNTNNHIKVKGKKVLVFLTTGCNHCRELAKKLLVINKDYPMYYIINDGEEKIDVFITSLNFNRPYILWNDNQFFSLTKGVLPTVLYLQDDTVKKKWTGDQFNPAEVECLIND